MHTTILGYPNVREGNEKDVPFTIEHRNATDSHVMLLGNESKSQFLLSNNYSLSLYTHGEAAQIPVKMPTARVKQVAGWRITVVLFDDGSVYQVESNGELIPITMADKVERSCDYICSGYNSSYLLCGRELLRIFEQHEAALMQPFPIEVTKPLRIDAGYDQVILLAGNIVNMLIT
jgi:hypothetical protein